MGYKKFLPLVHLAAAREALTKAESGPSFGSPPEFVIQQERVALTEILRGFVLAVAPGTSVDELTWSDYPTSQFEIIKAKISEPEFYDVFREAVAYLKSCEETKVTEESWTSIDVYHEKALRLYGLLERTLHQRT